MVQGVCCAIILGYNSKRGGADGVFFLEGEGELVGGPSLDLLVSSTSLVVSWWRVAFASQPYHLRPLLDRFTGFFSKPRCQIVRPFSLLPSVVQVLSSSLYIAVMLHRGVQDRLIGM